MMVTEKNNVFESDVMKLTVNNNGFTICLIKRNALYDTKDMLEGKKFVMSVLKEKKAYILLEAEGDLYTTKEARELAATPEQSSHHGAVAICSNKLAYKILGSFYIKINKPNVPTKFFTNREEAIAWLHTFIK